MKNIIAHIIACLLVISNVHAAQENIFLTIADHHLPTFTKVKSSIADEYAAMQKKKRAQNITSKKLSDYEKHNIVYTTLAAEGDAKNNFFSSISDEITWNDLALFVGPEGNKPKSLFKQLDYTHTTCGKATLQRIIAQPTDDIKTLQNRQTVIKKIASNKALFDTLKKHLAQAAIGEEGLLAMSGAEEFLNEKKLSMFYYSSIPYIKKTTNRSAVYLSISNTFFDLLLTVLCVSGILSGPAQIIHGLRAGVASEKIIKGLVMTPFMAILCSAFLVGSFYSKIKTYKALQKKLMNIAALVRTLETIEKAIQKNSVLAKHIPTTHIQNLKKKSLKLSLTLYNLKTNTFQGKPSFFSFKGRILSTYKLLLDVKHEFAQALEELGLIDAYVSAATMYNKFKDSNTPYCFTQYKTSPNVDFHAKDFWFPALLNNESVKHVVTNSIHLAGNNSAQPANIILTGPNTGGKSTILKGLISTAWLSQTLGIAPARNVTLTPFDKIMSCLNLTDDTSNGISLYKANLMRAKTLIESAENLKSTEKGLYVCDEPFNGTSKEETEQGFAYIAAAYAKRPNCIGLLSTHFNSLTEIADLTNGAFKNYKVTSEKHGNKPRVYHYTWTPGINHDHIATELMEEEGFTSPYNLELASHFAPKV